MLPRRRPIESRAHPRQPVALRGRLQGAAVEVRNVSPGGVQLQAACPALFFDLLRPKLVRPPLGLRVPLGDGGAPLELGCEVVYVNEDGGEYLLGLRVLPEPAAARAAWQRWLAAVEA